MSPLPLILLSLFFSESRWLIFSVSAQTQEADSRAPSTEVRIRTSPRRQAREKQIAAQFAPILYQELGEQPRADYLTNFDFDNDWRGDNNWRNLDNKSFPLRAWVYYSLIESDTHYFIHYAFFHPRDYKGGAVKTALVDVLIREGLKRAGADPTGRADDVTLSHENDLEGCLVVAEKNGANPSAASLLFVETMAHNRFYKYRSAKAASDVGDVIELKGQRPLLFIEAKGHGVFRYSEDKLERRGKSRDSLLYSYANQADDPDKLEGSSVGYDLVSIYETLWQKAQTGENETFGEVIEFQKFALLKSRSNDKAETIERNPGKIGAALRSEIGFKNKARAPWGWYDSTEKDRPAGEWFFDPASVIARHFNLGESFSRAYLYHPYFKIGIQ